MPQTNQPTPTPAKAKGAADHGGGKNYVSFIETQFPISKLSKESYKERKANYSQTLTGLGKWWGRKPLILVRATILGLLLPATDDPKRDREVFLKILTMDDEGMLRRRSKKFKEVELLERLTNLERQDYEAKAAKLKAEKDKNLKKRLREEFRALTDDLQKRAFLRLSYDDRLEQCDRPEHLDGPSETAWEEINAHLGTKSKSLAEFVQEIGKRRFGHIPRVGDAFCGGGSVPYEAARIGCESYASDLNPVATLLTWAGLNIVGGEPNVAEDIRRAQDDVYTKVDRQITEWGIEHSEDGLRADVYIYCNETKCPECGWMVPLAPAWLIGERNSCVAELRADARNKRFDILIQSDVTENEVEVALGSGTVKDSALFCPHCSQSTPIRVIRGDRDDANGLRLWTNEDLVPRPDDIFQERLYCIRWVETYLDAEGKVKQRKHYAAPTQQDVEREDLVLDLLKERFKTWQKEGFIPNRRIEPGDKTDEPIRTRGWTHWHHLFSPRQLLLYGTYLKSVAESNLTPMAEVAGLLGVGRCADYSGRLCKWAPQVGYELTTNVFANQALNTIWNYPVRGTTLTEDTFKLRFEPAPVCGRAFVEPADARSLREISDAWLTDPPYADAVNYHELSEYFLAWYGGRLAVLFPSWSKDSKRALAVAGSNENFRKSMVDCYRNLTQHMSDNGMQVVMFTHQDAAVWADLALILWASGLRVTAAWCIATETDTALKEGNYVQGTVLLVLRKQTSKETAFLDELYPLVENEVKAQLQSMLKLDDKEDPNFSDTDYQLAAYAAALRVLTQYRRVEDFDISYELSKTRSRNETSPIEAIIADAVKTACDYLVPHGFDTHIWKTLDPMERFYLKGLEVESHGEHRVGVYQELARGFGIAEYKNLLASSKANETRLKTATDFANRELNDTGFGATQMRQALFAVRETVRTGDAQAGKNWLRTEVKDYWNQRRNLIELLRYLGTFNRLMPHWRADSEAARVLAGAVENDHV